MSRCTPALTLQHAVRVSTLDHEGGRRDPRFRTLLHFVELDVEVATLAPSHVHAQQHLRPVGGIGAASTGVHFADRVALVVFAREQRAQLEAIELPDQFGDARGDLGLDGLVTFFAPKLVAASRRRNSVPRGR